MKESFEVDFGKFLEFFNFKPPIPLIGLIGNILGVAIMFKKKLNKMGPIYMYRALFLLDLLAVIGLLDVYTYTIGIRHSSKYICRFYLFYSSVISPINSFILLYILIERACAIKHPDKDCYFVKKSNQIFYLIVIIALSLALSIEFFIFYGRDDDDDNKAVGLKCMNDLFFFERKDFETNLEHDILLFLKFFLPIGLMAVTLVIVIINIVKAIRRLASTRQIILKLNNDIRIALACILMATTFIVVNSILFVVVVVSNSLNELSVHFINVYSINYAFNFYFLWFMSPKVRFILSSE